MMAGRSTHLARIEVRALLFAAAVCFSPPVRAGEGTAETAQSEYQQRVRPLLAKYCFDCHGNGSEEGGLSFEALSKMMDDGAVRTAWHRVLKRLRSDLMPPVDQPQPSADEVGVIESWIIRGALGLDPNHPIPGKVTLRRLNRTEYRNTIRDLMGVDYDTSANFPADNTGEGFDNIADVLSVSPLLLEKYFDAARTIVSENVPTTSRVMGEKRLEGADFQVERAEADKAETDDGGRHGRFRSDRERIELSYYQDATARATAGLEQGGEYQVQLDLSAAESYVDNIFDLNKCRLTFSLDGKKLLEREFVRQGGKRFSFTFDRTLTAGPHEFVVAVTPQSSEEQVRRLRIRLQSVVIRGPRDERYFVKPANYDRYFPRAVPSAPAERRRYASELLGAFAAKAFRRPVDKNTIERLADLAESVYREDGETFESGVAKAMTAVLASPRFIFREEFAAEGDDSVFPLIDEYSLASRLSYFLWSSMPDDELIRLARDGKLRDNLKAQVARMLADEKSQAFIESFTGQWLRAGAIETIPISARAVLRRETPPDPDAEKRRRRFFELARKGDKRTAEEEQEFEAARKTFRDRFRRGSRVDLTREVRRAMRRETEMLFEHIVRDDRSLLEIIDGRYTFLNETLARHYQINGVEGDEMRLVELPADSRRGGVLTQGTFLAVTSNPDRTSPVKRGMFILENLLGAPSPSPPPDVPPLEEAGKKSGDDKRLSLRESLAIHRENALCSSCHNRMDPLGLAFENFNALGRYREQELGQPIEASGVLVTGESFSTVGELKHILATAHRLEFYRCLTEKMMTYALGRGLGYGDIPTVDRIVNDLEQSGGRASVLLSGIISSAAFQRMPSPGAQATADN